MTPRKRQTGELATSPATDTGVDARQECYDTIIKAAKEGLARYYQEYPELIGDERSKEAIAWSTRGVERVLRILDGYTISRRER